MYVGEFYNNNIFKSNCVNIDAISFGLLE